MPLTVKDEEYYTPDEVGELYPVQVKAQTVKRHAKAQGMGLTQIGKRMYLTREQKETLVELNSPKKVNK